MARAFPAESLWLQLRQALKQTLPRDQFYQWIQPLKVSTIEPGLIVLEAPSRFHLDWIRENYLAVIQSQCQGLESAVRVQVQLAPPALPTPSFHPWLGALPFTATFQPSQTFDNYVVAPFNHFAFVAAQAICRQRQPRFNPLFIEGPPAIGKTHLLQAIGNACSKDRSGTTAYLGCRELHTSTQSQLGARAQAFKSLARPLRALLVDDIHLAPKTAEFQSGLLDIFDRCYNLDIQMVFTANRLPHLLAELPTGLRSRVSWGLIARIHEPDLKGCYQVIEAMLGRQKAAVSRDVRHFLSQYGPLNFHEIKNYVENLKETVERKSVKEGDRVFLGVSNQSHPLPKFLASQEIKEQICTTYNLTPDELLGPSKCRAVATARQVGMYLARKLLGSTYNTIGKSFGGRDHSTVIHACRKVQAEIKRNRAFLERVVEIERKLLEDEE